MLTDFVPASVRSRIAEAGIGAQEAHSDGVALFADISGFSALSESLLASSGDPEEISKVLNSCFRILSNAVTDHAGEIVGLAGDGLMGVWRAEEADVVSSALRSSMEAAQQAMIGLDGLEVIPNHPVRLRIGIGIGNLWEPIVGGGGRRWHHVTAGEAARQATAAQTMAKIGEIVISPDAQQLLTRSLPTTPIEDGEGFTVSAPSPLKPPSADGSNDELDRFVPEVIAQSHGRGMDKWIGEIRRVTIGFAHLSVEDSLADLQAAITTAEQIISEHRGEIVKIVFDDKGLSLLIVWGGHQRSDDANAARALVACQQLVDDLHRCRVGLATGESFLGVLGTSDHQEYTALGNTVNRAARIMQAAEQEVLCDGVTRGAARQEMTFMARGVTPMKGHRRTRLSVPSADTPTGAPGGGAHDRPRSRTPHDRAGPPRPHPRQHGLHHGGRGRGGNRKVATGPSGDGVLQHRQHANAHRARQPIRSIQPVRSVATRHASAFRP